MKRLAAVVSLMLVAPVAALAQPAPGEATDPVPVADTRVPDWSLGAGVGFALSLSSFAIGGIGTLAPSAPGAVASLERRLGPATWLALGVYGRMQATETSTGSGIPATANTDIQEGAVTLGLRQVVTRPGAPLAVSVHVLGSAGETSIEVEPDPGGGGLLGTHRKARATAFGASLGMAVDRELTSGLSLRVATGLLGASWTRSRTMNYDVTVTNPWERTKGWSAGVQLSPSLELRLAF